MTSLRLVFPRGRLRLLAALLTMFMLVNAAVRLGLAVFNGDAQAFAPLNLIGVLAIGAAFDLGVATFLLLPFGLLVLAWPARWRGLAPVTLTLLLPAMALVAFVAAAEFTFWNEFASRFNFIAVDYLVYTNEVIGNIRESYDLPLLLGGVGVLALVLWGAVAWSMRGHWGPHGLSGARRWGVAALLVAGPFLAVGVLDARHKEFSANAQVNELAGNGWFDFWHAFWANEIDYDRFYRTLPASRAVARLAMELSSPRVKAQVAQLPFDREVVADGAFKPLNVVLMSVESLSAEFLGVFGNRHGLTPRLDALAQDSLLFTRLYATGSRTVRGLEALTLSVPPTPGHSIVKRPDNAGLFTLGEVFRTLGAEPIYLYGGYGYFDNMNAFFSGNGYTVIDRTVLKPEEIHHENIWGVADEDLFAMTLRELDARHAVGKRFFAHVMTTSNHRPYTYPEGRIDIPSKSGRNGGVKYTDWAIGQFIDEARKRPWFDDTVFVIVADHTHKGRGKTELPIDDYHIPMLVYSPRHVAPGRVDTIASQIDVGPTILGLLNASYRSRFFGQDILRDGPSHQRALMANYQTVGYYEDGRIVELKPNGRARVVDAQTGRPAPDDERSAELVEEAISYYQLASEAYRRGHLRTAGSASAPR